MDWAPNPPKVVTAFCGYFGTIASIGFIPDFGAFLMRCILPALAFLAATILPVAAHANPVTGGAGGFSGSGTLTTTSNGDGSYTIVDITGTGVTDLIAPGGFNNNDNQLFPSGSSVVDGSGFSFNDILGNTGFQVNIFSVGAGEYDVYFVDTDSYTATLPVDLTVSGSPTPGFSPLFHPIGNTPTTQSFNFSFDTPTVTPEPSGILLLGTGLIAAAGLTSRSRRKKS